MIVELEKTGPRFIEMAHRIGMAVAATVDDAPHPHTRVMQPVWAWDGTAVTGWVSTATDSPKAAQAARNPHLSLTYWDRNQDTCTADCEVEIVADEGERAAAWQRFLDTPAPAGFDPAIHPDWEDHRSPTFGVWRLHPTWLRVMPGTLMTEGTGEVWTWRRATVDAR
jgi:general stress protein 26